MCTDAAPLEKNIVVLAGHMHYVGVLDLIGRIEEVARRKRREALGPTKAGKVTRAVLPH